jgi:hypothetical protein
MPSCLICNEWFNGHGQYCPLHNPQFYSKNKKHHSYNYDYDYDPDYDQDYPNQIRYRTGHGRHGYHKPHKLKFYEAYDGGNALYNAGNNMALTRLSDTALDFAPQNLQSTAQTFQRLTNNYAINNMRFDVDPSGTRSVSVVANKEREQCLICRKWFPNRRGLLEHKQYEFTSGCEVHNTCFGKEEEHFHGTEWKHDRCFVKGCPTPYRREGGWKTRVIEHHIRQCHLWE